MITIGLTGSIAMGKSEVARIFREKGIPVFDADKAVHDLYESSEGADLLRPFVPDAIKHNKVDRTRLSKKVLEDALLLEQLEPIVHEAVARHRRQFLAEVSAKGHNVCVVDVPLLFEKGGDREVDVTVVVSAPPALQRERALARPGMTEEKLAMIMKRQMPDAEKRKQADHIIVNDGTLQHLRTKAIAVLAQIKKEHAL